jgi:hypothetical protein
MSTSKSLLLLAQRAWAKRDQFGQCSLPLEIRQRWWKETDYSKKPLRGSEELIKILKRFRTAPRMREVHAPMPRETWQETFGDRSYEMTLRYRGDHPFLLRIMPSDAPVSPTTTRRLIGVGEDQPFLLCAESTVPIDAVRSALARLGYEMVPLPKASKAPVRLSTPSTESPWSVEILEKPDDGGDA